MTATTISNLYSNPWDTIYSLINNGIVDPLNGQTASKRKWIYTLEPDMKSLESNRYPILIISPPTDSTNTINLPRTFKEVPTSFEVEARVLYSNAGGVSGFNPLQQLETIGNSMIQLVTNTANIVTLGNATMEAMDIDSSNVTNDIINQQRVISRHWKINSKIQVNVT